MKEEGARQVDFGIIVELDRNLMEAYISVESPSAGTITRQEIDNALKSNNIVYGILQEEIARVLQSPSPAPVLIAKGTEAVHGDDANIEFKCLPSGYAPAIMNDGRVDFYNLNLIRNVEIGEVLAIRTPSTQGIPGYTVTGKEIPPKPGKNVNIIAGKNVELKNDGQLAVAASRGHAVVVGNRIDISDVHKVEGDIDFATGNINVNGSVFITGQITDGFTVTASGDVEVLGNVSGGTVVCDGNLKVRNGIIGSAKSMIKVKGSVYAKFIENARIDAGGDVNVGHAVLNSHVNANRAIVVAGKGALMGGMFRAGEYIKCKVVGSPMAACELEVGVNPEIRQAWIKLLEERKEKESHYDKAVKAANLLKGMQDSGAVMNAEQLNLLAQVTATEAKLAREIMLLSDEIERLEEKLNLPSCRIMVKETIFPRTKITLGLRSIVIKDPIRSACIRLIKHEINISPLLS